jgi:hypothetical protein
MTIDTPHPKTSALYWTGTGISINRVLYGTTKRKQNSQQHERVNCLKIEKRHKWVTYLTKQKELAMKDTYNKERLRRIKKNQEQIIYGHMPQRCGRIHINDAPNSKQEMNGTQESPLSDLKNKCDSNRIIKSV